MPNILEVLPCETLIDICSYLDKKDVKAARLTSKAFHNCSSEFLIDRAVVAARHGTLDALNHITSNPVFARTVRSVTFDTSSFELQLTLKDKYIEQFEKLIERCSPEERRFYFPQPLSEDLSKSKIDSLSEELSKSKIDSLSEELSKSKIDFSLSDYAWSSSQVAKGFSRYCQLYKDQQKIRFLGLDRISLLNTLQKCPNVKALNFEARRGPLIEDIDNELKGWCLEPRAWRREPTSYVNQDTLPALDLPGKIRSLSPFSFNLQRVTIDFKAIWPDSWTFSASPNENEQARATFSKVKYLEFIFPAINGATEHLEVEDINRPRRTIRRPVTFQVCQHAFHALTSGGAENMAKLIHMASNLEHLRIDFGNNKDLIWSEHHNWYGTRLFKLLNIPSHLETLELVGMALNMEYFIEVLEKHRGVLKKLSLIYVGLEGGTWETFVEFLESLELDSLDIQDVWGGN